MISCYSQAVNLHGKGARCMLEISFGKNRTDTSWKIDYMEWAEFVEVLRKVRRTDETMAEYDRMQKDAKDKIKNGRAFVGGFIKSGRRKKENVESRWLITLDADNADSDFQFNVDLVLGGYDYVIYSTHSSRPNNLKYRLVLPTNRAMLPDEYAAVSRKLAFKIGMHYFDKTTFDVHRLMYLPSCSKDAKPEFVLGEGEAFDADALLNEYNDWADPTEWPRHPDTEKQINASIKKLGCPQDKPGAIGVFCKIYGMRDGVETFLSDVYTPTQYDDRWTYVGGSSFGGMRVYDDTWAYSEHQSDPANNGHCYNIFDLIRIHKFRHLDEAVKEHTATTKYPSYQAMLEFAAADTAVKKIMLSDACDDFSDNDENWEEQLDFNPKTKLPNPTAKNAEVLLSHGRFKNVLAYDAFGNTEVICGSLPWRDRERKNEDYEPWLGADDKRLQHYFSKLYDFNSAKTLQNAFTEVVHKNTFHPIKDYIESHVWDGIDRVDRLFIRYLGADDTHYVRTVTRKMFIAAIKRLYEPGCKFDQMLVLVGPQGVGKSSLLAKLGRKWFSDSLRTFENKEAGEHLQSAWIFELGELSVLKKSELEEVKTFLSKTEDRYRVAYDRQVSEFPRKCVFFGTTNNHGFLQDQTGNRRFWPVDVNPDKKEIDHWDEVTDTLVSQIWAEALYLYNNDESLQLDSEAIKEAERIQGLHLEEDPREGIIQEWLESPIDDFTDGTVAYHERVCAAQIWCECLGNKKGKIPSWESKAIVDIMRRIPGWKEKNFVRVSSYGVQRTAFDRVKDKYT